MPRRNQPVIVLNHPDVDSPEVSNVMKVINKYKGTLLKVVLSERTRCQLGMRRHHIRLTYQNAEEASQIKRQMMLKMKLKKVHKSNYQVVDSRLMTHRSAYLSAGFVGGPHMRTRKSG